MNEIELKFTSDPEVFQKALLTDDFSERLNLLPNSADVAICEIVRIHTPRAALREGLSAFSFSRSFDRQRVSAAVLESFLWTMGPMSAAAVGALRRSARS